MAAARTAGTFLGGFFNNPGLVAIALGIGALLVFRKPITEAFASFGANFGKVPDINISIPEFPAIPNPFEGFDFSNFFNFFKQDPGEENPPVIIPGPGGNVPEELNCECGTVINQDAQGIVTTSCKSCLGLEGVPDNPDNCKHGFEVITDSLGNVPTRCLEGGTVEPIPTPTQKEIDKKNYAEDLREYLRIERIIKLGVLPSNAIDNIKTKLKDNYISDYLDLF